MNWTRRQMIAATGGAYLANLTLAKWMSAESRRMGRGPEPIRLDNLSLLTVDDSGLRSSKGVVRQFHQATTLPEPVIRADRPWEGERVYIYGSVYPDAHAGYRMWYMSRQNDVAADTAATAQGGNHVLYATSNDGLRWKKPTQGLFRFGSNASNNIVYECHSPSVLYDPRESNSAARYKMLGVRKGNYCSAESADGIHWQTVSERAIRGADTITLTQDPYTGEYLAFHKQMARIGLFNRRTVWLARSQDFRSWSDPVMVLAPDTQDDLWVQTHNQRTEIYDMSVYPHASGFLGLPVIFRVESVIPQAAAAPEQSPLNGPLDVQFATSPDGLNWRRADQRFNVIPRGPAGSFDAGAILGLASTPVHTERETWVYYTAITTGHGGILPQKKLSIGRAAWRRDGYASLNASNHAEIETVSMVVPGGVFLLNATIEGRLVAELRDESGQPLVGFRFGDCIPVQGDSTTLKLRWSGSPYVPDHNPVRLALRWNRGAVYALRARAGDAPGLV